MRLLFSRMFSIFVCLGIVVFAINGWAGCSGGEGVFCGRKTSIMEHFSMGFFPLFVVLPGFMWLFVLPSFEEKGRFYHWIYWLVLIILSITIIPRSSVDILYFVFGSILIESLLFKHSRFFLARWLTISCIYVLLYLIFSLYPDFNIQEIMLRLSIFGLIAFVLWYWPLHRSRMILAFGAYLFLFNLVILLFVKWSVPPIIEIVLVVLLCTLFLVGSTWFIRRIYSEYKPKEKNKL